MNLVFIILAASFLFLIILGLAVVNFSYDELLSKYNQLSSTTSTGQTTEEFATYVIENLFNNKIKIKHCDKYFSDSYNTNGTLTISSKYASKNNIASLAICAHELGHALQYKQNPKILTKNFRHAKLTKFILKLITPLFFIGLVLLLINYNLWAYISFGLVFLFLIIAIFTKLGTINLEKDASAKALILLRDYASFTEEELVLAKKFLNSAKQTYVADLLKIMLKWTMLVKK